MSKLELPELSIVIVTYNRSKVLVETINYLFDLCNFQTESMEIIVVDQTQEIPKQESRQLEQWFDDGEIDWIRLEQPNLTKAMNLGLEMARSDLVLYLDDDIIPSSDLLLQHLSSHKNHPDAAIIIGQVLQPGQEPIDVDYRPTGGALGRFMDFPFNCRQEQFIENAIACNMSVKRNLAIEVGGFDERFIPPVAARFETEFVKRAVNQGKKVWFEPKASIKHLAAAGGGTRALGSHLSSGQGYFGFGDYYFAMRQGTGAEVFRYCVRRFFREVRTKFHLRNPWYIPVKWLGEIRAFRMAWKAASKEPQFIKVLNKEQQ